MGWLSAILGVSYSDARAPSPDDDFWYGQAGSMTASGVRVSPDISMRISAVYACVNLLAKIVASLPLLIYERSGKTLRKEALGHPLYQVLEYNPNRWQTGFDFKATMMANAALRGNAIAEIVPGARGAVDRLEPIHPDRIENVERLPDSTLRFTIAADPSIPGDRRRVLLQDEVFHIRAPIQAGPLGVSPITYARQTMGLALAAEEHGARMFSNGVRPSGVVQMKGTMSDKAFDRFKGEFNRLYAGLGNAGKVPILEGGAEFKEVQLTADDVQFLGTREFQIEEICRWFDVPPVLLHHSTKSTSWGTGVETIMLAFVRNNLAPWLVAWEQAIRRDLILAPDRFYAEWDVQKLIRGDSRTLADFLTRLSLAGIITRNEARDVLGYDPLDGLDEPLTPSNTTTSDSMPGNGQQSPPEKNTASALLGHNGGPSLEEDSAS